MKKAYLALAVVASFALTACNEQSSGADTAAPATAEDYQSDTQKQSYALGASMGMYVQKRIAEQNKHNIETDVDALVAGFKDGIAEQTVFDLETIQSLAAASDAQLREKMMAQESVAKEENKAQGEAYLAENAKREGVVTTESGLQYEVLTAGDGASPTAEDIVRVHYKGTLIDGTEFDSSYKRNEPAEFPLNGVIPGWTEGVQLMKEGATYRFHIPAELAYGERQQGPVIGPNSTLVFDVELLKVNPED